MSYCAKHHRHYIAEVGCHLCPIPVSALGSFGSVLVAESATKEIASLRAELVKATSERDAALAEVAALKAKHACGCGRAPEFSDHWCGQECYHRSASHIARVNGKNESLESALSEALAALQLAREALVEQNYRLYMNRKTCRCWGKMTGSCPNCAKSIKIENQGSEAVSLADTALRKGEGR